MTWGGNKLPAVKIKSSVTLNRQLNRDTAKAIALEKVKISSSDGRTMYIVLKNACVMSPCFHALR